MLDRLGNVSTIITSTLGIFVFLLCLVDPMTVSSGTTMKTKDKYYETILDSMKPNNMKNYLRYLSEYPHPPGSERNKELAEYLSEFWKKTGFDKTEIYRYNILMSNPTEPGKISLRSKGKITKTLVINNEPAFDESEKKGETVYPFNAFSAKGTVTAEYVYANYGRNSDMRILLKRGVEIRGRIVICRYGKGSRSSKVRRAERYGAVGVIIYSDPYDFAYRGQEYPKGWTLNRYGVQRGTINRLDGDALSIGYPSKPNYFRKSISKYSGNPKIPSQPISYSTAYEILKSMKGNSIRLPASFQGGLNFTYALRSGKDRTLTLKVSTKLETKESLTVCTTLYGRVEPDRYVMLGNHRDAWTYGASDPSSGTAVMMEIVRSLGERKRKTGWRPRRSVMACSWGAEEAGVLGSTEWADENHKFITNNVVSYLNVDMAVEGNYTVRLKALRFLSDSIYRAAKLVEAPDDPKKTLYKDWLEKSKILAKPKKLTKPKLFTPRGSSDFKPFWSTYGTAIADFRYLYSKKDYPTLPQNGQYHTRYDSFGWMTKHIDPEFKYHLAIGRLMAAHMLILADTTIIPFDLTTYAKHVWFYLKEMDKSYSSNLESRNISFKYARSRLTALIKKTQLFHSYVKRINLDQTSAYQIRSINDKIMNFERNFLLPGISKKESSRNVVWASSPNQLKATRFPGISEAIYFATKERGYDWDNVRKQITLAIWCFDTASKSLDYAEWKHLR